VGGTTLTELADTLVRDHGLPFSAAHAIAARLLKTQNEDPAASMAATLESASRSIVGRALRYDEAQLQQIMSPRHFVEVRTTYGGPAPAETLRALGVSRRALERDQADWHDRRAHVSRADQQLRDRVGAL
jgi:argininosuccinate lyase